MEQISFNSSNNKYLEVKSFTDEFAHIILIKIRFKRCEIYDLFNRNFFYFIFIFNIIIFFILILFQIFSKTQLFLDFFNDGMIFYKNEKQLNLYNLKNQIKKCKSLKIHFDNQKDFVKREKPKISLIMTVFNQEHFIKYIYSSIQKQTFKEIELIIIDDASTDSSSKIIKNLMKSDKRIIYIKNKANKGVFYSRNKGVLFSKGEYILVIDPDDLLLNDILIKAYVVTKYYNLDILQYYVIRGFYKKNKIWQRNKYKSGILYSKKVKEVFFYSVSRTLWDKLIKRDIFISGIYFLKKKFQKKRYFIHSDDTIFWGIINSCNSYGFLEQIGYFYNFENLNSLVHHYFEINVLDMYINCSFFNETQIKKLKYFKYFIIKRKKSLKTTKSKKIFL